MAKLSDEWYLDRALGQQNWKLYEAEAVIEGVAEALEARFGTDWPANVVNYPLSLRLAAKQIRDAYENLEMVCVRELAVELRAKDEKPNENNDED